MRLHTLQLLLTITFLGNTHGFLSANYDTFDQERVHLIDYNSKTESMLFRGDIPRSRFNYYDRGALIRALKSSFQDFTKENNSYKKEKFPKKYRLVIISMMTPETEQEVDFLKIIYGYYSKINPYFLSLNEIPYETKYCNKHGDHWYWWWVRANLTHTPSFPEDVSWDTLAKTLDLSEESIKKELINQEWDGYKLEFVGLIELLKSYMEADDGVSSIIYLHSRNGINRSGATDIAYRMRRYGTNIESAWRQARITENKEMLEYDTPQETKTFLMYYKAYLDAL